MTAYRTDSACMLMSPATALARPLNQCPYCDHVSPANSKFCNECGAALHLKPCQHCGAVNDVTLTNVCARCNGALNEGSAVALVEAAQPPISTERQTEMPMTAVDSLPWQEARPTLAARPSPPLRLLLIAALALGGLGLYAFQHKPAPPKPSAVSPAPAPAAVEAKAAELTTPAIAAAPAAVSARIVEPAEAEASAALVTAVGTADVTAAVAAEPPAQGRPAVLPRPAARPPRTSPARGSNVEPPPPNIGPCTDAVAALGLCTPAPRRP